MENRQHGAVARRIQEVDTAQAIVAGALAG